jgi:hypothetical protein
MFIAIVNAVFLTTMETETLKLQKALINMSRLVMPGIVDVVGLFL